MVKKRTKLISLIAILSIIGGILSIFISIPFFDIYLALKKGGIEKLDKVKIKEVIPNSPAFNAGLEVNDVLISVNGKLINNTSDLPIILSKNNDNPINLVIERSNRNETFSIKPVDKRISVVLYQQPLLIKKPALQIVTEVTIERFLGEEEARLGLFSKVPYKDKTFARLRGFLVGIFEMVVGFGLWKMRKWAVNGFLILTGYYLVINVVSIILNPNYFKPSNFSSFLWGYSQTYIFVFSALYFIVLGLQLFFAYYIYKNKGRFR